jgi:hypothetical protein
MVRTTWGEAMITIHSQLENQNVFEPEALRVMSEAFHDTCNALQIFSGDEHGRRVIATRIIDLGSSGITDAKALRDRILLEARAAA